MADSSQGGSARGGCGSKDGGGVNGEAAVPRTSRALLRVPAAAVDAVVVVVSIAEKRREDGRTGAPDESAAGGIY